MMGSPGADQTQAITDHQAPEREREGLSSQIEFVKTINQNSRASPQPITALYLVARLRSDDGSLPFIPQKIMT